MANKELVASGCAICLGVSVEACSACGRPATGDPLLGATIADRYRIDGFIRAGGMGRVYRAVQVALGRRVAVKVIHRHLQAQDGIAERFMVEAQAASRLNHPNVVSVFDFGRFQASVGEGLFLVMEHLSGVALEDLIAAGPVDLERALHIQRQLLAALGEAHREGVVHRDVKPENIMLERKGGADLVKVIDFGVARLEDGPGVTRDGMAVGTPAFMAPEVINNGAVTPSADIYAAGIVLFQMLTGSLPFTGLTPVALMFQHATAPRPDPRSVVPERDLPAAIAEVCLRAMTINPLERYPTADAFADALQVASGTKRRGWTLPPPPPSRGTGEPSSPAVPRLTRATPVNEGRALDLAWVEAQLAKPAGPAVVVHGRLGQGRSTLLASVAARAAARGVHVVAPVVPPPPLWEIGYGGLQQIIASLLAVDAAEPSLANGSAAGRDPSAAAGLRVVFGGALDEVSAANAQETPIRALAWAGRRALAAANGAPVLLVIDDADTLDGASLVALSSFVRRMRGERFGMLLASEAPPNPRFPLPIPSRELGGISRAQAVAALEGSTEAIQALDVTANEFEPLYLDQLRRWVDEEGEAEPPPTLTGIIEQRILRLGPSERRALQLIAVAGGNAAAASLLRDLRAEVKALVAGGFVEPGKYAFPVVRHRMFRRVVIATTPAGALDRIHAGLAEAYEAAGLPVGLCAYHAVRGHPGFESFLLVEEAANLRLARGDAEGAIAALANGFAAARWLEVRGDFSNAQSARLVFGRKLGRLLCASGRANDAVGVLKEAYGSAETARARLDVLVDLVDALACEGHYAQAERLAKDGLALATELDDAAATARLRDPVLALVSVEAPATLFTAPYLFARTRAGTRG
ncbi:MAG TPA: protein kinase [Polyangiaceae bacterium]|nr:protein kinase [Polyangiaceae bacterium]